MSKNVHNGVTSHTSVLKFSAVEIHLVGSFSSMQKSWKSSPASISKPGTDATSDDVETSRLRPRCSIIRAQWAADGKRRRTVAAAGKRRISETRPNVKYEAQTLSPRMASYGYFYLALCPSPHSLFSIHCLLPSTTDSFGQSTVDSNRMTD